MPARIALLDQEPTSCGSSAMSGKIAGSGTDFPGIDGHAKMILGLEIGRTHFGITGRLSEAEHQERIALPGPCTEEPTSLGGGQLRQPDGTAPPM